MARTEQLYHIHAGSWVSNFIKLIKLHVSVHILLILMYLINLNLYYINCTTVVFWLFNNLMNVNDMEKY